MHTQPLKHSHTHTLTKHFEPSEMQSKGSNCRQHLIGSGIGTDVWIETQRCRKMKGRDIKLSSQREIKRSRLTDGVIE